MPGNISNREVKKHLVINRRTPYIYYNPESTLYYILINASINNVYGKKAMSIYNSTFKGVSF